MFMSFHRQQMRLQLTAKTKILHLKRAVMILRLRRTPKLESQAGLLATNSSRSRLYQSKHPADLMDRLATSLNHLNPLKYKHQQSNLPDLTGQPDTTQNPQNQLHRQPQRQFCLHHRPSPKGKPIMSRPSLLKPTSLHHQTLSTWLQTQVDSSTGSLARTAPTLVSCTLSRLTARLGPATRLASSSRQVALPREVPATALLASSNQLVAAHIRVDH